MVHTFDTNINDDGGRNGNATTSGTVSSSLSNASLASMAMAVGGLIATVLLGSLAMKWRQRRRKVLAKSPKKGAVVPWDGNNDISLNTTKIPCQVHPTPASITVSRSPLTHQLEVPGPVVDTAFARLVHVSPSKKKKQKAKNSKKVAPLPTLNTSEGVSAQNAMLSTVAVPGGSTSLLRQRSEQLNLSARKGLHPSHVHSGMQPRLHVHTSSIDGAIQPASGMLPRLSHSSSRPAQAPLHPATGRSTLSLSPIIHGIQDHRSRHHGVTSTEAQDEHAHKSRNSNETHIQSATNSARTTNSRARHKTNASLGLGHAIQASALPDLSQRNRARELAPPGLYKQLLSPLPTKLPLNHLTGKSDLPPLASNALVATSSESSQVGSTRASPHLSRREPRTVVVQPSTKFRNHNHADVRSVSSSSIDDAFARTSVRAPLVATTATAAPGGGAGTHIDHTNTKMPQKSSQSSKSSDRLQGRARSQEAEKHEKKQQERRCRRSAQNDRNASSSSRKERNTSRHCSHHAAPVAVAAPSSQDHSNSTLSDAQRTPGQSKPSDAQSPSKPKGGRRGIHL